MKPNHDVPLKIDEQIDAALQLFREIQPPAAMQSRIHQSLENAVETSVQKNLGWIFRVPATGVAIAAILLALYLPAHWIQSKQIHTVQTANMKMEPVSDRIISQSSATPAVSSTRREPMSVHRREREHTQYRRPINLLSYPLTKQEKLLLRFVQTAKPKDLRDLNLEYQAKVDAQQEAEFEAYLNSGTSSNKTKAADIE